MRVCVVYFGVKEAGRKGRQGVKCSHPAPPLPHFPTHRQVRALRNNGDHFLSQSPIFIDKEFEAQYVQALLSKALFKYCQQEKSMAIV